AMTDKMVVLAISGNPIEAELARAQLQAAGIRAYVLGASSGGLFSGMGVGWSNVQLMVPEGDYQRATELLTEETDVGREARENRERGPASEDTSSTDIRPVIESPLRAGPEPAPSTAEAQGEQEPSDFADPLSAEPEEE